MVSISCSALVVGGGGGGGGGARAFRRRHLQHADVGAGAGREPREGAAGQARRIGGGHPASRDYQPSGGGRTGVRGRVLVDTSIAHIPFHFRRHARFQAYFRRLFLAILAEFWAKGFVFNNNSKSGQL